MNPTKAVNVRVEDDDREMGSQNGTPSIKDSLGRTQNPILINESGLYSLVLSSKLPSAKQFKHWVTAEVLPSIRRHVAYATAPTIEKIIASPEFGIALLKNIQAIERETGGDRG